MDELLDRIEIKPGVMAGRPVIKGTRISVELIVRELANGWSESEILDAHPHLTAVDIQAARAYAATNDLT